MRWATTHLNKREVQLIEIRLLPSHRRLIGRNLHGDANDEVANPCSVQGEVTGHAPLGEYDEPCRWPSGRDFHLVVISFSRICRPMYCTQ